ncbi:MAG: hypothetical protein Q4D02_01435 [Clostridia bacterium]|nr:hypothetical protein [Clostridia bacterium]
MITKQEAIKLLETSFNNQNSDQVKVYIEKINRMKEEEWKAFLIEKAIHSSEDLKKLVTRMLSRQEHSEFIPLNHLISYGYNENVIHIHVVPKDARALLSKKGLNQSEVALIDALEKIQVILKDKEEFENVKQICAVSNIMKRPISNMFERLGFDVKTMGIEQAKNDSELSKFYPMFKDKNSLGRAVLSREVLFSDEWNKQKDERKKELLKALPKRDLIAEIIQETEMVTRESIIQQQGENMIEVEYEKEKIELNQQGGIKRE